MNSKSQVADLSFASTLKKKRRENINRVWYDPNFGDIGVSDAGILLSIPGSLKCPSRYKKGMNSWVNRMCRRGNIAASIPRTINYEGWENDRGRRCVDEQSSESIEFLWEQDLRQSELDERWCLPCHIQNSELRTQKDYKNILNMYNNFVQHSCFGHFHTWNASQMYVRVCVEPIYNQNTNINFVKSPSHMSTLFI